MHLSDQVFSEEDFEQLPPTVRRKYFSSLERLRFAHDGNPLNNRSRPQSSRRPSTSYTLTSNIGNRSQSLPCINNQPDFSVSSGHPSRTHLRKVFRPINTPSLSLSPQEFAALPPAIQRKLFSPEEQYHITSQFAPVILDAADEALFKQIQTRRHTAPEELVVCLEEQEEDWEDCDSDEETLEDMNANDLESFKWLDEDVDLDLKLDDYHTINQEISTAKSTATTPRRSSRRGFSFSNVSLRRRSSSSASTKPPTIFSQNLSKPASSPPATTATHQTRDSATTLKPPTTHYQDPAAKMKLRVYLASPQKFDEALEFGFPSLHHDALHVTGRPRTSPATESDHVRTFFSDDTPSLSEDDQDEAASIHADQHSPRTPIDMFFPGRRISNKSSTDRYSQIRPRIVTEPYAYASATEREMTLKMTLTRPELRNIEAEYGSPNEINDRPLEKAPLTVPFDANRSIWDDLPEQPSRLKRILHKLKGRP